MQPLVLEAVVLPQRHQHIYVEDGIFKLIPIQASVIYHIPCSISRKFHYLHKKKHIKC